MNDIQQIIDEITTIRDSTGHNDYNSPYNIYLTSEKVDLISTYLLQNPDYLLNENLDKDGALLPFTSFQDSLIYLASTHSKSKLSKTPQNTYVFFINEVRIKSIKETYNDIKKKRERLSLEATEKQIKDYKEGFENLKKYMKSDRGAEVLYKFLADCHSIEMNANDTFGYALAQSVNISSLDLWWALPIIDKYSYDGETAVMAYILQEKPIEPHITLNYKKAYQEIEELNPYLFAATIEQPY